MEPDASSEYYLNWPVVLQYGFLCILGDVVRRDVVGGRHKRTAVYRSCGVIRSF